MQEISLFVSNKRKETQILIKTHCNFGSETVD